MPLKNWSASELRLLRNRATKWYQKQGRSLPWRETNDPYCVWVSEIMLQQTQVATVIPYYHKFLARFPNVRCLAQSSIDDVLFHWAGLGYYRRARQLHAAAIAITSQFDGVFPTTFEDVLGLPGIGRYTAGAILSFATDARHPILEANTIRLYARLLRLSDGTSTVQSQRALWEFADDVLPTRGEGSGQINQALMEIGSQLCTPKLPECSQCPLQSICPTHAEGLQSRIPVPKEPKLYTDLTEASLIVCDPKGNYLIRQCTLEERWSGLWDFPRFDITQCTSDADVRATIGLRFRERFASRIAIGACTHTIRHAVTRYRITLRCFEGAFEGEPQSGLQWSSRQKIDALALCASAKKLWGWVKGQSVELHD